ncbi:MAG TPA: extracellular solute-binding protein, partial [Verrucomicrobiota bacterium]|nr:extracellular solute-binding protein [Verrucomicrobiota bacterium]
MSFPAVLKHQLIHPRINAILGRAGHHAKVLIADGNYPASTKRGPHAEVVCLNLAPGIVTVAQALRAVLSAVPVDQVMKLGGVNFDPSVYVSAVSGYYTAPNGQMLSFPFNSSTTVFHYNKDAFKAAGLDPNSPPKTWPEVALAAAKLKASGHRCPFTTSWVSWTQLESFSAWHNTEFATLG